MATQQKAVQVTSNSTGIEEEFHFGLMQQSCSGLETAHCAIGTGTVRKPGYLAS